MVQDAVLFTDDSGFFSPSTRLFVNAPRHLQSHQRIRKPVFRNSYRSSALATNQLMPAFTLTGLFVSIVLAIITSWVSAAVQNIISAVNQQLFGLIKSAQMSGVLFTGVSGGPNTTNSSQNNLALGSAGSISFTLSPPTEPITSTIQNRSSEQCNSLTIPKLDTTESMTGVPSTPVLRPQTGDVSVPLLSLDTAATPVLMPQTGGESVPLLSLDTAQNNTTLITSSPYAQNEGLTFPKGTSLWQPKAGTTASSSGPTQTSTSLITASPFTQNEGVTIPSGTPLWQVSPSTVTTQQASTPGLWTPSTTSSSETSSGESLSMRPMGAPLPAQNLVTSSPYCTNENITIPAGTPMWQSSGAAAPNATGETSLITSSPYCINESVTFPQGTSMWQPRS